MAKKSTTNRNRDKKANNDKDPESEGSSTSIGYLIWIIPIIAIIIFGLTIYSWFTMDTDEGIFGMSIDNWRNLSTLILIVLIVILVMVLSVKPESTRKPSASGPKKRPKPTNAESKPTKMVVIEAIEPEKADVEDAAEVTTAAPSETSALVMAAAAATTEGELEIADAEIIAPPAKKVTPNMIEYPKKVEGGIYGDTFITVDESETLKLRTLVVEDVYLA